MQKLKKILKRRINKIELDAINAELDRTGIKEMQMIKMYKVDNLSSLSFEQFKDIMANFEKTPNKKKVDLGL